MRTHPPPRPLDSGPRREARKSPNPARQSHSNRPTTEFGYPHLLQESLNLGIAKPFAGVLLGLALTVIAPTITPTIANDSNDVPQTRAQTAGATHKVAQNVSINIFYGRHIDANDFALLAPALETAFMHAKNNKRMVVVFAENSVIGDLPYVGFAREFERWDPQRLIKDSAYKEEFSKAYAGYLANQRRTLETIDWQMTRENTRPTYFAAMVRYLAAKVVDEKIAVELRQEEPPLAHLIARLKSETVEPIAAVEQMRDRKFVSDVLAYIGSIRADTTVIIIRGAYHQEVTQLLESAGYDVQSFFHPFFGKANMTRPMSKEEKTLRTLGILVGGAAGLLAAMAAGAIGRLAYRKIRSSSDKK